MLSNEKRAGHLEQYYALADGSAEHAAIRITAAHRGEEAEYSPWDDAPSCGHRIAASVPGSRCTAHPPVHTSSENLAKQVGRAVMAGKLMHGLCGLTWATCCRPKILIASGVR